MEKRAPRPLAGAFSFFGAPSRCNRLVVRFLAISKKTKEVYTAEFAALAGAGVCQEGSRQDAGATKYDKQEVGRHKYMEAV